MADNGHSLPANGGGARACLWVVACLAVLWTAYFARQILVPMAFAVLLKFLLSPIVRGLRRLHVPAAVSSLLLLLGGAVAGVALVMALAPAAMHWTNELPERLHLLESKVLTLRAPVAAIAEATTKVGEKVEDLAAAAKPAADAATVVRIEQPTMVATAFGALQQMAVELFMMVALLFLMLLSDGLVLSKLQADGGPRVRRWLDALRDIERRMGLYVRSVLIVHGAVGVAFALFCWAWGMPSPWLWGALVAVGNAIPFAGPLVVTGVLGIVALTSYEAVGIAMAPPLVYVLLHLLENNVVTPCLLGRWLSLSPVGIFIALIVMGFLWGVPGLLLAVPILVVARITSDYVPSMRALQLVLDGRTRRAAERAALPPPAAAAVAAAPIVSAEGVSR